MDDGEVNQKVSVSHAEILGTFQDMPLFKGVDRVRVTFSNGLIFSVEIDELWTKAWFKQLNACKCLRMLFLFTVIAFVKIISVLPECAYRILFTCMFFMMVSSFACGVVHMSVLSRCCHGVVAVLSGDALLLGVLSRSVGVVGSRSCGWCWMLGFVASVHVGYFNLVVSISYFLCCCCGKIL